MRFLREFASDSSTTDVVEINTLADLLVHLDDAPRQSERGNIIISRRSFISDNHDRLKEKLNCEYILTIYDSWIE